MSKKYTYPEFPDNSKSTELPLGGKWNPVEYIFANTDEKFLLRAIDQNNISLIWDKLSRELMIAFPELYPNARTYFIKMAEAFRKYDGDCNEMDETKRLMKSAKALLSLAKKEKRYKDIPTREDIYKWAVDNHKKAIRPFKKLIKDHKAYRKANQLTTQSK